MKKLLALILVVLTLMSLTACGAPKETEGPKVTFTITVVVTNENGVLSMDVTYPEDGIEFVNSYKEPPTVTPDTGDHAPVTMMVIIMLLSAAAVIFLLVFARRKRA